VAAVFACLALMIGVAWLRRPAEDADAQVLRPSAGEWGFHGDQFSCSFARWTPLSLCG
jgi:hypothetical protein